MAASKTQGKTYTGRLAWKNVKPKPKASPRREPGTTELLVWGVPEDLKNRFKAACAANGKDIKEVIVDFMASYA